MSQEYYQCDEEGYNSSLDPQEQGTEIFVTTCSVCDARKVWSADDLAAAMEKPFAPCGCHWRVQRHTYL
jgi:hypothetical protein